MICSVDVKQVQIPFNCQAVSDKWEYTAKENLQFSYQAEAKPFEANQVAQNFGYRVVCSCGNAVGDGSCLSDYTKTQNL